jgi:iron complex outermembrane receptor protein
MRVHFAAWLLAGIPTLAVAAQPTADDSVVPSGPPAAQVPGDPISAPDPTAEPLLEHETTSPPEETAPATPAAPSRGSENAVTQAEDAFGFSSGKETLGLYTSSNVRGFSPVSAGNVRIDGLYFDQVFGLTNRVRESTSIRVGLSAHGIPFPAPTGIVDYRLYKPDGTHSLSALLNFDSYGTATVEGDTVIPLDGDRLSLGAGFYLASQQSYDGTSDLRNIQGLSLRWRPSPTVDLMPFWTRSEISDGERAPRYIPAGPFLPPKVARREYRGPDWADFDSTGITYGLVSALRPSPDWLARLGLFRSRLDDPADFAQLFRDLQPDGRGRRILIADPPSYAVSNSGELRISRTIADGPRRHLVHFSLRGRDRRTLYGGSDTIDYGRMPIAERFDLPQPTFAFGPQSRDRVKQWTGGVAYDAGWVKVGEVSVGLAKTDYRKEVRLPGLASAAAGSKPWLYYGSVAGHLSNTLSAYASYTRGLEESGVAPDNATNRNEPLPAILTSQREIGLRYALTPGLRFVAGLFELKKPYYNLNQANRFELLGDVRNRGLELSLSGAATPKLNVVAGAVLLKPRVTGEGVALGRVGPKPVGLPARTIMVNLDWRPPIAQGLSFDVALAHASDIIATRDNRVSLPARTLLDIGARYRFELAGQGATLRVKLSNLTGEDGFQL